MARADLHYALVLDREIYEASQLDPSLLDPVVRLEGSLPGPLKPVIVLRMYQGPQGFYRERFTITDPDGHEIYRSPVRRVELTGEFTEDRFVSAAEGLVLDDAGEHTAHFFIDETHVGSVPVFVEAGHGGDLRQAIEETFKAAVKKGDILWVTVPGAGEPLSRVASWRTTVRGAKRSGTRTGERTSSDHSQGVWFVWEDGTVYVLNGETEQHVPGLSRAKRVLLTVRSKDVRSTVAQVHATVHVVDKGSEEWDKIADKALAARLNVVDDDEALARWRERCDIVALTPQFRTEESTQAVGVQMPAAAPATGDNGQPAQAQAAKPDEPKVEAGQIDQETYDQLIAEGKSERVATAKAKAAYVRKEKARLKADQAV